jgi:molybdate transport system ATP-binding protein
MPRPDARDAPDAADARGALAVKLRVDRGAFSVDVDFVAPPGVTVLFGPSGSGKSTTLAAIAGLVEPRAGRIALGAEVWFDADARVNVAIERRHVAFVFQSLALFPHMTALANVTYGMGRAMPDALRRERAVALLGRLGVGHLAERKPRTFSGGEAQRVALARAFAMSPRAVLMDEPFSAMDQKLRAELLRDVRAFVDELGVPLVFVTHHRGEARQLGDRGILIDKGRIEKSGTMDEVLPIDRDGDA